MRPFLPNPTRFPVSRHSILPLALLVPLALPACMEEEEHEHPDPTISITAPLAAASVALDPNQEVAVAFTVTDFTLAAPGSCGETEMCGHVHLTVDGVDCNDGDLPYNNAGAASPLNAKLGLCAMPLGSHTVAIALHDDAHGAVLTADGAAVADSVSITTTGGGDGPSIHITSPGEGQTVELGAGPDAAVPVEFEVAGFTLMAPGTCAGAANCGHVHLSIDEDACNQDGAPYNNAGAASPLDAQFAACAVPDGAHTIKLALHNDSHAAVTTPSGDPIVDTVSVTTAVGTAPGVTITSPTEGGMLDFSTAAGFPAMVEFSVANFTLMAPGTCGATEACGHAHLVVDGEDCNMEGAPYNNAGAASPITANLGECTNVLGSHAFTVELHNDDHSAHMGPDGLPVAHTVTATVGPASGEPVVLIRSPVEGEVFGFTGGGMGHDVKFEVGNFTLMAPGTCGATEDCGHVHFRIDGDACNMSDGSGGFMPYNVAAFASPANVNFGPCPNQMGDHMIEAALRMDDHGPVVGALAVHSVGVTVQ